MSCSPAEVKTSDINAAQEAYNNQNYSSGLTLLTPMANDSNATAQLLIGNMYAKGQGIESDASEAANG